MQYLEPLVPVQQPWPGLQLALPQQKLGLWAQMAPLPVIPGVQQVCPDSQFLAGAQQDEQLAACARLVNPSNAAPARAFAMPRTALRRGMGVASARARSSMKSLIICLRPEETTTIHNTHALPRQSKKTSSGKVTV